MKQLKKWEIWGAATTIITGTLLHFVYDWSGENKLVGFFGAVNESTWEHLKLAFWPSFIIAILAWLVFGRGMKNFCLATAVKLISMPLIIIGLFYGWLLFFPDSLAWDIIIFDIAVIVGYFLSYRILQTKRDLKAALVASVLIMLLLAAFCSFSYFPPRNLLFRDPVTGGYGPGAK